MNIKLINNNKFYNFMNFIKIKLTTAVAAIMILAAACGQKQSKDTAAQIDILSWTQMPADAFGCMLEKTFAHRDKRFNCSLTDYVNHGDPCGDSKEYYEGPEFPQNLVKQVHPWIESIQLDWEGGMLQHVLFSFDQEHPKEQILSEFGINLDALPENIESIDVDEKSISITGFMHVGAGDVDCGDDDDDIPNPAPPPPAVIVGTWKAPVKSGQVAYLEIYVDGMAGLYLGDSNNNELFEIYYGTVLAISENEDEVELQMNFHLDWYVYESSDGKPVSGVPDSYNGTYTLRHQKQGNKHILHVNAHDDANPFFNKKELKMELIQKTCIGGSMCDK